MADPILIALSCTKCGANLKISADIERFFCVHCGTPHFVRRSEGSLAIEPLLRGIERVQHSTDKTAAELAVMRLTKEIGDLNGKLQVIMTRKDEAWLGRPIGVSFFASFALGLGFIAAILLVVGNWWWAGVFFAGAALGCCYCFMLDSRRAKKIRKLREREAHPIRAALRSKQEQLKKNRLIADS